MLCAKQKGVHGRNACGKEMRKQMLLKLQRGLEVRCYCSWRLWRLGRVYKLIPGGCRFQFSRWGLGLCFSNKLLRGVGAA